MHGWGNEWGYNYGGDDEMLIASITALPIAPTLTIAAVQIGIEAVAGNAAIQIENVEGENS